MGSSTLEEINKELGKDPSFTSPASPQSTSGAEPAADTFSPQASAESVSPADTGTLQDCLDHAAAERIKAALAAVDGNRVEAASALGVDRTTLYRLMKRLGL
ncbi:MAG: helix-turn-helix domain-containing protein, partial [Candidatus Binataceae bacterium]